MLTYDELIERCAATGRQRVGMPEIVAEPELIIDNGPGWDFVEDGRSARYDRYQTEDWVMVNHATLGWTMVPAGRN